MSGETVAPTSAPRPSRPIAAVIAVAAGAAATIGYSAYRFPDAYAAYRDCIPLPPTGSCPYHSFWGFSPTFYLLATIIGFVAGGLLALMALVLWVWPRYHDVVGVFVLSATCVSVLAYAGAGVGLAAGVAGGILAIRFRPPRFRQLNRWSAPRALDRPSERPGPGSGRPGEDIALPELPPLSGDAYAPLPKVWRPFSVVAPARTVTSSPTLPRFGTLAEALASQQAGGNSAGSAPGVLPPRTPPPLPEAPPRPAPSQAAEPPLEAPGTGRPAALPSSALPPVAPASSVPAAGTTAGGTARVRAWKCPRCELTNAPWSKSCTRCQMPAPPPQAEPPTDTGSERGAGSAP